MDDSIPSGENKLPLYVSFGAILLAVVALLFAFKARSEAKTAGDTAAAQKTAIEQVNSSVESVRTGSARQSDVAAVQNDLTTLRNETSASITQIGEAFKKQNEVIGKLVSGRTHGDTVATKPGAKPEAVAAAGEYIVKSGDTGFKIAKANGVSTKALEAANPGVNFTKLKVGQKIKLPEKKAN